MQIIYCDPTEAEKDFYEALFKRSKVFFFFKNFNCNLYLHFSYYCFGTENGHIDQTAGELYAGKVW
jgi:hypothetical protein